MTRAHLVLLFTITLIVGCSDSGTSSVTDARSACQSNDARHEAQLKKYDEQAARTDAQLAKAEKAAERMDALILKWEAQAKRYDALLDKWEKQKQVGGK